MPSKMPWLEATLAECRAAWPTLNLDLGSFGERLGALDEAQRQALHATDLYLAFGCAAGDSTALELFEGQIMPKVQKTFTRLLPKGWQAADAAQALRTRLFVGAVGDRGIDRYSGRGALVPWVRTVATRLLLDARKKTDATTPLGDSLEERLPALGLSVDVQAMQAEVVPAVRAALKAALGGLPPKDRTLLKLHYVDGLSFEQIGRVKRVHRSTVLRWLQAIRDRCLDEVKAALAKAYALQPGQLDSLLEVARSQLELSLTPLLKAESAP